MQKQEESFLSFADIDIIWDIDSTLITTNDVDQGVEIIRRPGLQYFYDFCRKKCRSISIWTAAESRWVDILKQTVLKGMEFRLVLDRSHCVVTQTAKADLSHINLSPDDKLLLKKTFYAKDLDLLWAGGDFAGYGFQPSTTLVVDDFPVGLYQNPGNLYPIKRYKGDDDSELFRLCCWIDKYDQQRFRDIRGIIKAIT